MCSRYHIRDKMPEMLKKIFPEEIQEDQEAAVCPPLLMTSCDILPSMKAPVLIRRQGRLCMLEAVWGFPGIEGKGLIINARSETALEKRMFAESVEKRRCLVPASGFYEWSETKDKYYFTPGKRNTGDTASALLMAGCYRRWEGETRFVILTTSANSSVGRIHPRMPLILEGEEAEKWLAEGEEASAISQLLKKAPAELEREQTGQLSLFG